MDRVNSELLTGQITLMLMFCFFSTTVQLKLSGTIEFLKLKDLKYSESIQLNVINERVKVNSTNAMKSWSASEEVLLDLNAQTKQGKFI